MGSREAEAGTLRMGVALAILIGTSAAARAEWRYCYAAAPSRHEFYMSAPFQVAEQQPMDGIEASFRMTVQRLNVRTEGVACPRGTDQVEIGQRMRHAADYNRSSGNAVIPLDWSPSGSASARY